MTLASPPVPAPRIASRGGLVGWRILTLLQLIAGCLKGSAFGAFTSVERWTLLQFGALFASGVWVLVWRQRSLLARRLESKFFVLLIMLIVLAASSSLWSVKPSSTLAQATLLFATTLALLSAVHFRWTRRAVLIGDVTMYVVAIAFIQSVGLYFYVEGDSRSVFQGLTRFQGITVNPNYAGYLSALALGSLPLVWATSQIRRSILVLAAAPLVASLLLTGSRGPLLAVIGGLIVFGSVVKKQRISLEFIFITVALLVSTALAKPSLLLAPTRAFDRTGVVGGASSGRIEIWREAVARLSENPVYGTGYRTYQTLPLGNGLTAHNLYLDLGVELGILGTVLGVLMLSSAVRAGYRGYARLLLPVPVVVCINELFETSLTGLGSPTALTAWTLLAITIAYTRLGPERD